MRKEVDANFNLTKNMSRYMHNVDVSKIDLVKNYKLVKRH